jgi:hypothetical protein
MLCHLKVKVNMKENATMKDIDKAHEKLMRQLMNLK